MNADITLCSRILVVDDSLFILKVIREMLKDCYDVCLAQSAEVACEMLSARIPDIILLDLEMPRTNGYELLKILKSDRVWREIPVIFLTSVDDHQKEEQALDMGAVDYIIKPISEGVLKKRIQMHLELTAYQKRLESLVDIKTQQLLTTQDLILDILANVTTYRDNDTGAHIVRTTEYARLIAQKLLDKGLRRPGYQIDATYAKNIAKSAKLHDIGKIGISDGILLKTSKLSPIEYEIIKMHTVLGAQMLDASIAKLGENSGFLVTAKEIVLYHHEWWNGEGYPEKLSGTDIPLSARIMAIADVYDALISKRPYKRSMSHDEAVDILERETGTHFDTVLMDITFGLLSEFEEVASTYLDE